jgi:hypothetical protein
MSELFGVDDGSWIFGDGDLAPLPVFPGDDMPMPTTIQSMDTTPQPSAKPTPIVDALDLLKQAGVIGANGAVASTFFWTSSLGSNVKWSKVWAALENLDAGIATNSTAQSKYKKIIGKARLQSGQTRPRKKMAATPLPSSLPLAAAAKAPPPEKKRKRTAATDESSFESSDADLPSDDSRDEGAVEDKQSSKRRRKEKKPPQQVAIPPPADDGPVDVLLEEGEAQPDPGFIFRIPAAALQPRQPLPDVIDPSESIFARFQTFVTSNHEQARINGRFVRDDDDEDTTGTTSDATDAGSKLHWGMIEGNDERCRLFTGLDTAQFLRLYDDVKQAVMVHHIKGKITGFSREDTLLRVLVHLVHSMSLGIIPHWFEGPTETNLNRDINFSLEGIAPVLYAIHIGSCIPIGGPSIKHVLILQTHFRPIAIRKNRAAYCPERMAQPALLWATLHRLDGYVVAVSRSIRGSLETTDLARIFFADAYIPASLSPATTRIVCDGENKLHRLKGVDLSGWQLTLPARVIPGGAGLTHEEEQSNRQLFTYMQQPRAWTTLLHTRFGVMTKPRAARQMDRDGETVIPTVLTALVNYLWKPSAPLQMEEKLHDH